MREGQTHVSLIYQPGLAASFLPLFKCVYLCKYVFAWRPGHWASVQHMAVRCMVSAPWSLLISLTQRSRSPPPRLPFLPLLHLPHTAHTHTHKGKSEPFVFCVRPAPCSSSPPSLSFSSPLTKSLFRLDTAENHMACDIIRAGSRERGMVEHGRDWLARSLCGDVSRKALWEARWGARAEQVGNCIFFFFSPKNALPPG